MLFYLSSEVIAEFIVADIIINLCRLNNEYVYQYVKLMDCRLLFMIFLKDIVHAMANKLGIL
jgi:hypothetical protein